MSDQILKFGDAEINEKKCHASKQQVSLDLMHVNKIVISDKQHSDNGSKYFIASEEDDIIRPLCIALPQMSRHIKHFDNGGKICPLILKIIMYW